ncbi:acyl carrier protein [Hydrocarboniphaga daqingensis]|uniref:Acyl carrier protein n=1 Tax=Hydrocarboniphaga daqingensis TaxID=490188 RepID=A0A1M5P3W9_9GAMM|nr:acyl carrier protein [Hydrocarboniphaga daqingensis]SHG96516.1 acyl carrier protein [Hydrocarboniphaga daqingensis]
MNYSPDDIRVHVTDALRAALTRPADIEGSTRIVQDLGLDSLAVMNLMMSLEDHYDVSIPLDRVAEIVTVDDLVKAVVQLTQNERA